MKIEQNGLVAHVTPSLVIYAPKFFAREDFMAWLNQSNAMSWHDKTMPTAGEYADTVVLLEPSTLGAEHPEGTDSDMPEDIWREIAAVCLTAKRNLGWSDETHSIAVRLVNLED